ncbi:uncharacterized protein LOC135190216 isoform X2 [Pogoniulus pusillus]|uniref:uncharacterized protein LOC135190216 isoform X2 n=1 Tax=Pogoniulus pusillus TaxID=488313 RepID=UPI0030B98844
MERISLPFGGPKSAEEPPRMGGGPPAVAVPPEPSARRSPARSPPPFLRPAPTAAEHFSNFSPPGEQSRCRQRPLVGAGPGDLPAGGPAGVRSVPAPYQPTARPAAAPAPAPAPYRSSSRRLRPPRREVSRRRDPRRAGMAAGGREATGRTRRRPRG